MLFDIHRGKWSQELLELFHIPASLLPTVMPSKSQFGTTAPDLFGDSIPLLGIAGDQQAALFGQQCTEPGMAKCTYGTGCFLLMQTGKRAHRSNNRLLTTLAASGPGESTYALEGSVFVGGAAVQWLRDELGIIRHAAEIEELALSVPDSGGVYVVPAFTGLGAPYWNPNARGAILGLTRGVGRAHIARATLESIAYQCQDVLEAMQRDYRQPVKELRVDGGASGNDFLMQFQADICGIPVRRPTCLETTALGAAMLAGGGNGSGWKMAAEFMPQMQTSQREKLLAGWKDAVERVNA
jgi:glycerol kinase